MDTDLALVLGLVMAVFSVPALASAFSDSRRPTGALTALLIGALLILYAVASNPEGYAFADVPHVFAEVVARFWP